MEGIGLKGKSSQRGLAQVTATLDTMEGIPEEVIEGDYPDGTMEGIPEEVIEGDYPDGSDNETMEDIPEEVVEGNHSDASEEEEEG